MKRAHPVLTMTTDWGLHDHYVAAFKGQVLHLAPQVTIVDISHQIEQFNILQASYLVRNAFPNFTTGTIHFIGINNNNTSRENEHASSILAIESMEHVFVGSDSGIFSLILGEEPSTIYRLSINLQESRAVIFSELTGMIAKMVNGHPLKELGTVQEKYVQSYLAQATFDSSGIRAVVLYVDDFGNAIINITQPEFEQARDGRKFTLFVRRSDYNIEKISSTYEDAVVGEIVAFFNEDGYLEIALNRSSAAGLLGMKLMDSIRIEFHD